MVVLGRGWKELWRLGYVAGSQPRIAEGVVQDVGHWMGLGEPGLSGQE